MPEPAVSQGPDPTLTQRHAAVTAPAPPAPSSSAALTSQRAHVREIIHGTHTRPQLDAEKQYEHDNPKGEVDDADPHHLILWNFEVGHAEPKPEHIAALERLLVLFLMPGTRVDIEGHASSSGARLSNQHIAHDRAMEVRKYLIDQKVDPGRIHVMSYGSSQPAFPNITPMTMARNRRVDVRIVAQQGPSSGPEPTPALRAPAGVPEPVSRFQIMGEAPNGFIKFKYKYDPNLWIPLGPWLVASPSGEVSGIFKLTTKSGSSAGAVVGNRLDVEFGRQMGSFGTVKISRSGPRFEGSASFEIMGITISKPAIGFDFEQLLKGVPIIFSFALSTTLLQAEWPPGSGLRWEFQIEGKPIIAIGPSDELLAELGAYGVRAATASAVSGSGAEVALTGWGALGVSGAATLGGVAVGVGLFAFSMEELINAPERGEERTRMYARRQGYAVRLAGAASRDLAAAIRWMNTSEQAYYPSRWEGWQRAEDHLNRASPATVERLRQVGRSEGGGDLNGWIDAFGILLERWGDGLPERIEDLLD